MNVPNAELIEIGGVPTLAIQRYDRIGPSRVHQEDGLQATGFPSNVKYESDNGPSLRRLSVILNEFGVANDVDELLRRTVLQVVIGNADAHPKNISFLHHRDDIEILLAPIYDIASTVSMEPVDQFGNRRKFTTKLGQFIDGTTGVSDVTKTNLVNEGISWGMREMRAQTIVSDFLETAHEVASENTTELSATLIERIGRLTDD